ncbi:unnamed protein product [Cuscuta campestris]|uniref:Reverse transcriptase domain-containing protein n=1 Tax=Cuscuta campestris TaxID=132261 RepID=A0A484L4K1_9ASTE|nr:unnamed protein product [Cuscuta campestris]
MGRGADSKIELGIEKDVMVASPTLDKKGSDGIILNPTASLRSEEHSEGSKRYCLYLDANSSGFYIRIQELRIDGFTSIVIPEGSNKSGIRLFVAKLRQIGSSIRDSFVNIGKYNGHLNAVPGSDLGQLSNSILSTKPQMAMVEYTASTELNSAVFLKIQTKEKDLEGVAKQIVDSKRMAIETNSPEYKANFARFTKIAQECMEPCSITTRREGNHEAKATEQVAISDSRAAKDCSSEAANQVSNTPNEKSVVPNSNILIGNKFQALEDSILLQNEEEKELPRTSAQLANGKLIKAVNMEVDYWRQKANNRWLDKGDTNSKLFQAYAKGNRKKLSIKHIITSGGRGISSPNEIKEEAIQHYKKLYTSNHTPSHSIITSLIPKVITKEDNMMLSAIPNINEVKKVVWEFNGDSASGPNGFNGNFFKTCWETIKNDVLIASQDFFLGKPIPCAYGSTYLTLIPKTLNPKRFDDYRPISLSTFMSKINTKILSNRLNTLLHKLISLEQAAFQKGRSIDDHILVAQEAIHIIDKKVYGGNTIVKIDMAKAFDKMEWSFIEGILNSFGFSD